MATKKKSTPILSSVWSNEVGDMFSKTLKEVSALDENTKMTKTNLIGTDSREVGEDVQVHETEVKSQFTSKNKRFRYEVQITVTRMEGDFSEC